MKAIESAQVSASTATKELSWSQADIPTTAAETIFMVVHNPLYLGSGEAS